jgi:hypothetical protein
MVGQGELIGSGHADFVNLTGDYAVRLTDIACGIYG